MKQLLRESSSARAWLLGVLLVAAVVFAYQPAWNAGFIWDDDDYVTNNPLLTAPDGLQRIWFSTDSPSQYFPAVYTTFRIERALWGLDAAGFHWVNILLHAANGLLLWRVLWRLRIPGAWLGAAVFALHPVQAESVAWITELKNVQSLFFFLLALLAWMRWVEDSGAASAEQGMGNAGPRTWYAAALGFHALALFSKTTAVTLPAALLLVLWLRHRPITWRRLLEVAPFVAVSFVMGLVSIWWERHHQGTVGDVYTLTWLERVLVASRASWFYLGKLLWPSNLTFSYAHWDIRSGDPRAYVWLLAGGIACALIFRFRRVTGRGPEVAAVFFLSMLSTMAGFFVMYTFRYTFVADHYQYVAMIGPTTLVAAGLTLALRRAAGMAQGGGGAPSPADASTGSTTSRAAPPRRRTDGENRPGFPMARWLPLAIPAALVLGLSVMTWRQAHMYENLETLWRTTVARNPDSYMGHNNLGAILLGRGEADAAIERFRRALEILPHHGNAHGNLGHALVMKGRFDEALAAFRRAVEVEPGSAKAHSDLGFNLLRTGKIEEAVAHCRRAVEIAPNAAEAHCMLALALLRQGRFDDAIAQARIALDHQPAYADAHNALAGALLAKGEIGEALAHGQRAVELAPAFADAHFNVGTCLFLQGQMEPAIAQLGRAVELDPDLAQARINLGAALAQLGRFEDAKLHLERALAVDPANLGAAVYLGRILLDAGRAEESLDIGRKAAAAHPDSVDACRNVAFSLCQLRRFGEAFPWFEQMMALQPGDPEVSNNFGLALLQAGRVDEAIARFEATLKMRPDFALAHLNLAAAALRKNDAPRAAGEYRACLAQEPDRPDALADYAWLLATWRDAGVRDGAKAIELARRANEIAGDGHPAILRSLAAAYAEGGRFDEAVATAQRALQIAETQSNGELARALRAELELYRRGLPYREPDRGASTN